MCAMNAEVESCDLSCVIDVLKIGENVTSSLKNRRMEFDQPLFSPLNRTLQQNGKNPATISTSDAVHEATSAPETTAADNDLRTRSREPELCVEHESELDWFCSSEQKLVCFHCTTTGSCVGHAVTSLDTRVTAVRNQLVDVCEKMQLQAQRIERFIEQTLNAKERALQVGAAAAREQVLAQAKAARDALEEEEQRLLEAVQREEERVEACLLTQRAHWGQALASLGGTRARLVHALTHTPDAQLATAVEEIGARVEEAEGVGEPRDTDQLSLNAGCVDSRLLRGLWASALLLGPRAHGCAGVTFDENTVSPLLSLSDDRRTLTFLGRRPRQSPPYNPARFDHWPNALGRPAPVAAATGPQRWVVDVGRSAAFKVGVCYADVPRKGAGDEARLGYNGRSWVLSHYDGAFSALHAGRHAPLAVVRRPRRVGVLLDRPGRTLLFYDADAASVLHAVTHAFSGPLLLAVAVADRCLTIEQ